MCAKYVSKWSQNQVLQHPNFKIFLGEHAPDPRRMVCFARWDALRALLSSLKLCTGLPDQCQIASDSPATDNGICRF